MVVPALPSHRRVVPLLFLTILAVVACKPGDGGPSPTSAATMAVTPTAKPVGTSARANHGALASDLDEVATAAAKVAR